MGKRTAKILGFMTLATIFGVVRAEIVNVNAKATTGSKITSTLADPFLVMGGGIAGTAILLTISDVGGNAFGDFAVGLAGLTLLGSVIYAGPSVFSAVKGATTPKTASASIPAKQGAHP